MVGAAGREPPECRALSAAKLQDRPAHRHMIGVQLCERILEGEHSGAFHPLSVAIRQPDPTGIAFRVAQLPAVAFSRTNANASGIAVGSSAITGAPGGVTHTHVAGAENMSESPFLDSVERRRPGTSMRAYVTRTLPHSSAVVVAGHLRNHH